MVGNLTHLTVLLATVSCGKLSFRLQLKAKNEGSANDISGLTKLPGSYLRPRRFSMKCQRGTLSMMKKKARVNRPLETRANNVTAHNFHIRCERTIYKISIERQLMDGFI